MTTLVVVSLCGCKPDPETGETTPDLLLLQDGRCEGREGRGGDKQQVGDGAAEGQAMSRTGVFDMYLYVLLT